MLKYKDFLNENNKEVWTHEGDFVVNENMINNGRFIKGKIPDIVTGSFYNIDNNLTSLEGGPDKVTGYFNCNYNQLTSLEGAPKEVGGDFSCSHNNLVTLEGCPKKVEGYFDCDYNQLISLEYGPIEVKEYIYCSGNKNNLKIEVYFIKSGSFKTNFYMDLLKYCINNKIDLEQVESWPKNFISDNMKTSSKSINKFNL